MAKNTSFALGDHFADFVDAQVQTGRFASASEVVRAALRMLEENETKLKALRDALDEGEKSGYIDDFDFDDFLANMNAMHANKQKTRKV